jgi:hypothetical protein
MDFDQLQRTLWLLMVMVMCVAMSQLATFMMMIIHYKVKTMWRCGANKLGNVKKCGCARLNNQQQDLVTPIEGYEVKRPLV